MTIDLLREAYVHDLIDIDQFEELVGGYLRGDTPPLPQPVMDLLLEATNMPSNGYRVVVLGA